MPANGNGRTCGECRFLNGSICAFQADDNCPVQMMREDARPGDPACVEFEDRARHVLTETVRALQLVRALHVMGDIQLDPKAVEQVDRAIADGHQALGTKDVEIPSRSVCRRIIHTNLGGGA